MMRMSASWHAFLDRKEARQGKTAPSVMGAGGGGGGGIMGADERSESEGEAETDAGSRT